MGLAPLLGQLWVGHPGYLLGFCLIQRVAEAGGWPFWNMLEAWVLGKGVFLLLDSAILLCFRVNVCGGRCCHGWSKAPGSQRCTKRKLPRSQWPCTVGKVGGWVCPHGGISQGPLERARGKLKSEIQSIHYLQASLPPRKGWVRVMLYQCQQQCIASKISLNSTEIFITLAHL